MPRPAVERVARSVRLRADVDASLVKAAKRSGRSINTELEMAVLAWTDRSRGRRASVETVTEPAESGGDGDVAAAVTPLDCPHATRRNLGYATRCADCGTIIRP